MQKKLPKFIVIFCLFSLFLPLSLVLAQERKLEIEYPKIFGIKPETVAVGLPEYVNYLFNFSLAIFGLIVFGALIRAGFLYLTSVGEPIKRQEAKDRISSAFLGLFILLISYLIFVTINPELVIFRLPPLKILEKEEAPPPPPLKPEETSLITEELPLGQTVEAGLWSKERITKIGNLVNEIENFLNQKIIVASPEYNKISDLNKYLKNLTQECRCEYLNAHCTSPQSFALPIGCSGDPCKKEQDKPEVREEIEKILTIDNEKIKALLEFEEKIIKEKNFLELELNILNDIEEEIISCQPQGLVNRNEYLANLDFFQKQGWNLKTKKHEEFPPSQGDPLTFYCPVGGTFFDYPYATTLEIPTEMPSPELPEETAGKRRISCLVEYPLGEILDEIRELAVLTTIKLEKTADLLEKMAIATREMVENVSQCNKERCKINCSCVPNPCFLCCSPIPCFACVVFCRSPCLQAVGTCSGIACPREEIEKAKEEIYNFEKEILNTLPEIRNLLFQVSFRIENQEDPKNLKNVREGMSRCTSPETPEQIETMEPSWTMFNCPEAIGNFGPEGQIIDGCHARNFFCCLFSEAPTSPAVESLYISPYINPADRYLPLPLVDNCPKGYLCESDVKSYNQYDNDASEPLKQLLACMEDKLDNIITEKDLKDLKDTNKKRAIGKISAISDSKLYEGTCDWYKGPKEPGGCSYPFEVKYGKERISAHYGGPVCRYERKSYAVDFSDLENAEYLIEAAKKCVPSAYIIYKTPGHFESLHISIAGTNQCGTN